MDAGDRAHLRELYRQELRELLAALNEGLLALEQATEPDSQQRTVNELFRAAHTLKGAAHSAGDRAVASRCHELEERLVALRQQGAGLEPGLISQLYALVDAIPSAGSQQPVERAAPAPSPALPGSATKQPPGEARKTVRLQTGKLELLVQQAGELLLSEQALSALLGDRGGPDVQQLRRATRRLRQAGALLDDGIRTLRMAPFAEACAGLARLARDVAAQTGKSARVEVVGGDVELDRPVLDRLREPLAHLVRNAVDHGIEAPSRRRAAGKPEQGIVTVRAELRGGRVLVQVSDDGAGVDLGAVRAAATARGLAAAREDVLSLLLVPGLSTAPMVTETSGRGVGLDAVRAAVESLGGGLELRTHTSGGLVVDLLLPLTLAALRVVLVVCGGRRFALASTGVDRLARAGPEELRIVEGRERLVTATGPVPLVPLAGVLGLPDDGGGDERFPVVLATSGGQQVALAVDALGSELEVTVRGLGPRLAGVPAALGGAVLPDGRPVTVLSPTACARLGLVSGQRPLRRQPAGQRPRIKVLLVEDSVTTRTLERAILEAAGYEVLAVADGVEAWGTLGREHVDVVVSDVSMPRLDGFGLCERIRSSPRHADLPVILVTSRSTDADRLRGLQAGANAYLIKQAFDQGNLLDTIEQLVDVLWVAHVS